MTVVYLILAILSSVYFVILQILSPLTFVATLLSFSMIWLLISGFFIFLAFSRKSHLWSKIPSFVKNLISSVIGLVSILCIINLLFIIHPTIIKENENVKYVILLGGGITKDKKLSDNVQERCKKAADYLKKNPESLVVVTGGKGYFSPCAEADVLKEYLESMGIKEKRIIVENQAKDTIQNLKYSAEILSNYENKSIQEILDSPVLIVSSFNHIARAQLLAKRMGFNKVYGSGAKTPWIFVANAYLREIFAYMKLILRIVFTNKPGLITE